MNKISWQVHCNECEEPVFRRIIEKSPEQQRWEYRQYTVENQWYDMVETAWKNWQGLRSKLEGVLEQKGLKWVNYNTYSEFLNSIKYYLLDDAYSFAERENAVLNIDDDEFIKKVVDETNVQAIVNEMVKEKVVA
jgi:hypothetical protein